MRKYQFKDRADAESAYKREGNDRRRVEWLFTALLQGRLKHTAKLKTGETVGFLLLTHSALVYSYHHDRPADHIHCGLNTWDVDDTQLADVIAGLLRYDESHEYGRALDQARSAAYRQILGGAA